MASTKRKQPQATEKTIKYAKTENIACHEVLFAHAESEQERPGAQCQMSISYFAGDDKEDVSDWLRQFKHLTKFYIGITDANLHLYASSYLRGEAGRFYDDLQQEPSDFREFARALTERFGKMPLDRSTQLKIVLNHTQKAEKKLRDYVLEMYNMGKKAAMDEQLIIQTIINNMQNGNKSLIRLSTRNNTSFKEFLNIIETVEIDNDRTNTETGYEELKKKLMEDEIADKKMKK